VFKFENAIINDDANLIELKDGERSTPGRMATVVEPGPRPIGRIPGEVRRFNLGSIAANAHVNANGWSAQREHVDIKPSCERGASKRRLGADNAHDGEKGILSAQHRNGGRVSTRQGASSTGTDVSSPRGGIAGPRSHSSTIFWLVSSSTILERLFHGMKGEKVDLRQGLDKRTPSIDEAGWPFKSGELWSTGASEPCVLRPEVPIMMNAATISMADRLQLIPMSRRPYFVGLVCHDNSLTHIRNNYTISILKSSTIPIHVDFTILTIADPVRNPGAKKAAPDGSIAGAVGHCLMSG
jgi:hypothetical protein